jgi:hypothetical protein
LELSSDRVSKRLTLNPKTAIPTKVAESINVIGGDFLVHPVMMTACITQPHFR